MSNLDQLEQLLRAASSSNHVVSVPATQQLFTASKTPGFTPALIQIFGKYAQSDPAFGLWLSISFKSHILRFWTPENEDEENILNADDRQLLRQTLVPMLTKVPTNQKAQIAHSIGIVSSTDFPSKWPTLIDELVQQINSDDLESTVVMFETLHFVLCKYRTAEASNANIDTISKVVQVLLQPMMSFTSTLIESCLAGIAQVQTVAPNAEMTNQLLLGPNSQSALPGIDIAQQIQIPLQCIIFMVEIYIDMNSLDLCEFIQTNMVQFIQLLLRLFSIPLLNIPCALVDYTGTVINNVHSVVFKFIELLATHYEEEFAPAFEQSIGTVWSVLISRPNDPAYDTIICSALTIFSALAARPVYASFFTSQRLNELIHTVLMRHLVLRIDDVDFALSENYLEYLEREVIGQGVAGLSKRGAVKQIISVLTEQLPDLSLPLLIDRVNGCTAIWKQQQVPPEATIPGIVDQLEPWQYVEAAFTILSSIGPAGLKHSGFPIQTYLAEQIVPLTAAYTSKPAPSPLLIVSTLKTLSTYVDLIPSNLHVPMLETLVQYVKQDEIIVASYSAYCISKFVAGGGVITPATIEPIGEQLIGILLQAASAVHRENQFIIAAAIVVIGCTPQKVLPIAENVTQMVFVELEACLKEQKNQQFVYLLFELLSLIMRIVIGNTVAEAKTNVLQQLEAKTFPSFQEMLSSQDFVETHTFVLSVMAMFLEEHATTIPNAYLGLWQSLLQAPLWKIKSNIPSIARFITAFLHNSFYVSQDVLGLQTDQVKTALLGIYQRLLSDPSTFSAAHALAKGLAAYTDVLSSNLIEILRLQLQAMSKHKANDGLRFQLVWLYCFWICTDALNPEFTANSLQYKQSIRQNWIRPEGFFCPNDALLHKQLVAVRPNPSLLTLKASFDNINTSVFTSVLAKVWPTGLETVVENEDKKLLFRGTLALMQTMNIVSGEGQTSAMLTVIGERLTSMLNSIIQGQETQLTVLERKNQKPVPGTLQFSNLESAATCAMNILNNSLSFKSSNNVLRTSQPAIFFDWMQVDSFQSLLNNPSLLQNRSYLEQSFKF